MSSNESTMTIEDGRKIWRDNQGQRHRIDGPAIEHADGAKFWYQNGQHHRLNGPATEEADGTKEWWIEGQRVRAVVVTHENGTSKEQYVKTYARAYEVMCDNLKNEICSWCEELK